MKIDYIYFSIILQYFTISDLSYVNNFLSLNDNNI